MVTLLGKPPALIEWKYLPDAIVQDADGKIIHNAAQQDSPVVRQLWDDGVYALFNTRTGKLIGGNLYRLDEKTGEAVFDIDPDDIRQMFFMTSEAPDQGIEGPSNQPAYTG